jgi:hypothetical protein
MSDATLAIPATNHKPHSMRLMLYVAGFVVAQIFSLLLVLVVASTPWFLKHDAYPGMLTTGYSLRLKHVDCEIVIYGDSSTLTGLDPDIIQEITGLKTCNLAEGISIESVVGSRFPLDTYLKNNKRPRFLLTMYTPSMFRPYIDRFNYFPDGVLYALQYDRSRAMYRDLLRRQRWVVDFDLWAGCGLIRDFLDRHSPGNGAKPSTNPRAQRDSRHGIWPFPLPPETHCVRTAYHLGTDSVGRYADSVAEMRKIYGVGGTTVLVNMAPVPTCDTLQQTYRERSEGLRDNAFETLPISYFNEGDVHFSPEGSRYISIEAANQILALEGQRRMSVAGTAERPK